MNEFEKVKLLNELEPIISYNVNKYLNYRRNDYEDLMQEARMIVYENLDRYDETKASLSTFCQTLIRNNLVCWSKGHYRNWDKVSFNEEFIESCSEISDDCSLNYLFDKLTLIIEENKEKFTEKELSFLKLFVDKKSFKEIEEILEITANYRRQLICFIKKKLAELIKGE